MNLKLTAILLLIIVMQVSATTSAQEITLRKKVTLVQLFKEIRKQTGYNYLLSVNNQKKESIIHANFTKTPLKEVLRQCLEPNSLIYSIEKNTVLVAQKEKLIPYYAAQITIKGRVVDENGKALAGASIHLNKANRTVITDAEGRFFITNVDENETITIAYVGYQKFSLPVSADMGDITLKLFNESLNQVTINTGYQSLLKERAPGSFNQVGQSILSRRPVADLSTALQGMVSGMQAKENADGSVNFLIRGNSSMYADRNPLVVVDGFPLAAGDFSKINPNDVETVTVLKDAAAASIWGARSANGVIVITTKRAKAGQSSLKIDASVFTRVSAKPNVDQLSLNATAAEQVAYEKMAFKNGWFSPGSYTGTLTNDIFKPLSLAQELLYANKNGQLSDADMNAKLDALSKTENKQQIKDLLLRRSILSQYNVSFSGATEKTKTYASLLFEDSKLRQQYSGYKRYGLNFNNEYTPAKFITLNTGVYLQYRNEQNSGATLEEIQGLSPYETLLNPDGSYSVNIKDKNKEVISKLPLEQFPYPDWSYNLLREVRGRKYTTEDLSARIQIGANIKILPGLSFDTKVQYERNKVQKDFLYSEDTYYVRDMVNYNLEYDESTKTIGRIFVPKGGILQTQVADVSNYVFRNQLNFDRDIGSKHSINAIVGTEISQSLGNIRVNPWLYGYYPDKLQTTTPEYGYGSSVNILTDITGEPINGYGYLGGGNTDLDYTLDRFVSYYGNAAYTYNRKYTLSVSFRSDASNFITKIPSLRWEPLWSIGALWNIKDENFAQKINWIDHLSLRATYGRNGNAEKSSSTNTLLGVDGSLSPTTGTITASINDNGNPTLRWEKTITTNIGIDFILFNNKLTGKIDVYNKVGKDITGKVALPAASGTISQKFNNAEITNKGIEIELGTSLKLPNIPLFYSTAVNYAYNKNVVNNLYNPNLIAGDMVSSKNTFVQGRPVNPVYSFTYLGTKDGVPQVAGPNGIPYSMSEAALVYESLGLNFLNYEGTTTPPHTLGWYNDFKFKGFQFSVLLIGKMGGVYRNDSFNYPPLGSDKAIANRYIADIFAGRTDIPAFPKIGDTNFYFWDRYYPFLSGLVESSSYIECKEMTLDYTLPLTVSNKLGFHNIKIYAQARDLGMVWVANKNKFNPDWLPGTDRPLKNYTLGINFGF